MYFEDRHHAGKLLAAALRDYAGQDGVIYALPRGGVPLAVEIGAVLGMPVELLIARKIGHPNNPEYAICAVSEGGELVCNEYERASVSPVWLAKHVAAERAEAARRRAVYRGGANTPATGRLAIVVDDGIATGLTMFAAIRDLKEQHPKMLVVAIPVAPTDAAARLRREADVLVALEIPESYAGAVGSYYDDFSQLTDRDVVKELQRARSEGGK